MGNRIPRVEEIQNNTLVFYPNGFRKAIQLRKKLNIPDNYDFFIAHEAEMGAKLDSQPVCVCCEEPIQDDHMYDIYGDIYCEDCMIAQFRRSID